MAGALSVAKTSGSSTRGKTSTRGRKTTTRGKSSPAANYERLRNRIAKASSQYKEGVSQTVHVAETQGSLALAAFAAGYLGPAKMRIFNSPLGDVRLLAGAGLLGFGLMNAFDGSVKGGMAANHMLALGSGLLGAVVYEHAHNAGVELAAKKGKSATATKGFSGRRPVLVSGHDYDNFGNGQRVGARLRAR